MLPGALGSELRRALGADDVIVDAEACADACEDIAGGDAVAAALLRPRSLDALCAIAAAAQAHRFALVPRGGGHSYTGGTVPDRARSLIVDMAGLNRVLEIDTAGRWVRVEAGCTWADLLAALEPRGLRTPFFGPLSGQRATVGGALSNGAGFFGSAMHGFAADSVAGLAVVLAGGDVLRSGVGADGRPHPRAGGPNLGALFLGDCGAFGIKAEAILRLRHAPTVVRFASFAYDDFAGLLRAQAGLAGQDGIAECFGFDPQAHANLARGGFRALEGARIVADVVRQGGSLRDRIAGLAGLVQHGRRGIEDLRYSLHLSIEAASEENAAARLAAAAAVALAAGGTPIPDTIPRVTRARPFRPIKALLGPDGERWLPLHGVFRHTDGPRAQAALENLLAETEAGRRRHEVAISLLTVNIGDALLIEPHLFWPDALGRFHLQNVTRDQRRLYADRPARPEARAFAHDLRARLAAAFREAGAEHLQIARYYPYVERLDPARRALLQSLKAALDPHGVMNPGALLPAPGQGGDDAGATER